MLDRRNCLELFTMSFAISFDTYTLFVGNNGLVRWLRHLLSRKLITFNSVLAQPIFSGIFKGVRSNIALCCAIACEPSSSEYATDSVNISVYRMAELRRWNFTPYEHKGVSLHLDTVCAMKPLNLWTVTWSFYVSFDLRLNERLRKESWD